MSSSSARALSLPPSVAIGTVIAGKYRIDRVLGSGGMGVVVAASHIGLRQTVAIKFLLPKTIGEPVASARLLREARAAAALGGQHVARVFDVDVLADGAPYVVMEYLEGQTLASLIETEGPLAPQVAVDWALQVCEALAEAHALGIVHRDLKPANLFLARGTAGRQVLRVLDFGIAKEIDREQAASTSIETDSHALVGSPPYVSPEQLVNPRALDFRTDIWSLGVTLFECLSGRLPFRGDTVAGLWDAILREPLPELRATAPDVPPGLERVIRRCLEKQPPARYRSVGELARALAPYGSARGRLSLEIIEALSAAPAVDDRSRAPSHAVADTVSDQAALTEEPTTRAAAPVVRRRWHDRMLASVLVLLGLGTASAFLLLRGANGRDGEAAEPAAAAGSVSPRAGVPPGALPAAPPQASSAATAPAGSSFGVATAKPEPERRQVPRQQAVHLTPKRPDVASSVPPAATPAAAASSARSAPVPPSEAGDEAVYSNRK